MKKQFRGIYCIGSASFLSFVALVLLICVHVGQISTSKSNRGLSMAEVNVSSYGHSLALAFADPIEGLYTSNSSAPLGVGAGLRQVYKFGLYSHCAYVNKTAGICGNRTVAYQFQPDSAITSDMLANYTQITDAIILNTTFRNNGYLGASSKAAYYFILLGTICTALALFTGTVKHTLAFLISTVVAVLGSLFLLIGAAIWTVLIKKSEAINTRLIVEVPQPVPSGYIVSAGPAIYLLWTAVACMMASIIPYMTSCCTYRG